ncbi:MAG: S8 family serine peptidase [Thermoleophilia bacterium]|nr:S8 family serine peptidase [Thermoleophilia bacterium]
MTRSRPLKTLATGILVLVIALAAGWIGAADRAPAAGQSPAPDAANDATEPVGSDPGYSPGDAYVPGEVIVQKRGENVPRTVELGEGADVPAVADRLEERRAIEHATPNYIARISGWGPNDPGINPPGKGKAGNWRIKQWNFLGCGSLCHPERSSSGHESRGGMNVVRAWQNLRRAGRAGAAGVRVAVLDTGIAYRNDGRFFRRNPDLEAGRFLPGRDFVDDDSRPLDLNGHGTHVAGTIGQQTDNRLGLTGIAFRSKLIPVRVMDASGFGTTENITRGIRWATDHGARVISMSLNFRCGESIPPVEDALEYAHSRGVTLVGSTGNRSAQSCPSLPATAAQVIGVGGTSESGCVAGYSFISPAVDIAAPGGGAAHGNRNCPFESRDRPILQVSMAGKDPSRFKISPGWRGTSMAAAHVAGAAAAVLASGTTGAKKGPAQVKQRLLGTARLPDFAADQNPSGFGAGIVDLGRATNPAVVLP